MFGWKEKWERETEKGQWIKRLIPNFIPLAECEHKFLDYFSTQFFMELPQRSGRGHTGTCDLSKPKMGGETYELVARGGRESDDW